MFSKEQVSDRRTQKLAEVKQEVRNVMLFDERVNFMARYLGKKIAYRHKSWGSEVPDQIAYIKSINPLSRTMMIIRGGKTIEVDLTKITQHEFELNVLFFESLIDSNEFIFTDPTPYELMPEVIPFKGQRVRYEGESGETIIGQCTLVTDTYLQITGNDTAVIVSLEDFALNGFILENNLDIELEAAKPEILGNVQTIEEITQFILDNPELTEEEKSKIKDYIIYRQTKPEDFKDIPEGQYSKVRFVDGLINASLVNNQTLETVTSSKGAKGYIEYILDAQGRIRTQKGTVLNLNPDNHVVPTNEKEVVINLTEAEYNEVHRYTTLLLDGKELDSYTTAYNLGDNVLASIDQRIKAEKDDDKKASLMKVKKALGIIVQGYFDYIDEQIDEERVLEVESVMREIVNRPETHQEQEISIERGEVKMVMVNGYTGGGKGTTLELLNAKASESGTDGIAGRGDGFEDYEQVMGPYDLARFAGEYIPNKLMRLLFATEIINQRLKLDAQGRYNEPVYVSGFPRTDVQARLFEGVEGIRAVSLNITPETAVFRVVRRMVQNVIIKHQAIRGDDLSDIEFKNTQTGLLTPEMLKDLIIKLNEENPITSVDMITPERVQTITDLLALSKGARYFRYDTDKVKIEQALNSLGVSVYQITGDELTPSDVADIVRGYISGEIEA